MSKEYIQAETNKIITSEGMEFPLNIAMASSWTLAHFKAENIKLYNVSESSSLSDYYIIASMQNTTQSRAAIETLSATLKAHGQEVLSIEGLNDTEWVLIDLGDIIVHIFQENAREVYGLDVLWKDYPQEKIPTEYYMGEKAEMETASAGPTGYF
jgi:ribosome-associated protein